MLAAPSVTALPLRVSDCGPLMMPNVTLPVAATVVAPPSVGRPGDVKARRCRRR